MTKRLITFIIAVLAVISASAQFQAPMPDPVKWNLAVEMTSETEGVATLTATIDKGWHLYGTDLPQGGPQPTVIKFNISPAEGGTIQGPATPSAPPTEFDDPDWGMQLTWWEKSVSFRQPFKLSDSDAGIRATVTYMTCNGEQCIPAKVVSIKRQAAGSSAPGQPEENRQ